MKVYLISRLVREDYIIPAYDEEHALKTFSTVTKFKDESIKDLVYQHNIQLQTDIMVDSPILEEE